jgi:putative FmdB family regulatory protein
MPIYEYQCTACGHQLEAFQSMSEAPLTDCPACHQAKLQKLVSAAGFQLKGTGWYATDFKNKGKPEPKKDSNSSEGGQSDSAPISKDSKTDSAT